MAAYMNQYSLSRPRHQSDTYSNKQDKNAAFSLKVPDWTRCHREALRFEKSTSRINIHL